MIEVKKLNKSFSGQTAVDEVSFSVEKGKTLVLLGKSGCGKTTTLKMINRLIEPDAGEIYILGENAMAFKPEILRRKIGYVIQGAGLFPHYSVAENIATVPHLLGWTDDKIKEKTSELLEMMDLPQSILTRKPAELSGGQQQRVGIARALAAEPPVVLLDEPFGALDPLTRQQIRKDFKELDSLVDTTIVMVTHDVSEAVELGDEICLMDKGKIVQKGTPKDLVFSPKNEFVKEFFANEVLHLGFQLTKVIDLLPWIQPNDQLHSQTTNTLSVHLSLADVLKNQNGNVLNFERSEIGNNKPIVTDKNKLFAAYQKWIEAAPTNSSF